MSTVSKNANFLGMAMDCAQVLVNKRGRKPSIYGWVCIFLVVLVTVNLMYYHKKGPSGINPRFKETYDDLEEDEVDVEVDDPAKKGKHNLVRGKIRKIPAFDPNREQHPLPGHHVQKLKKYGLPKPKEFPVELLQTPRLECVDELLLILIVESTPESQVARNASRHSWGRQSEEELLLDKQKWLTFYVMGKPRAPNRMKLSIREENEKYKDILQGDFYDSPYEGTRKFMMAANWLASYIQSGNLHNRNAARCLPRFVLKTQGNIFHNMPSITGWLENKFDATVNMLYMGHKLREDFPVRDPAHPMYVSEDDYTGETFPDMIREPIYLFSYDTFVAMEASINIVTPIAMEDAYIGLLAQNIAVQPKDNDHFHLLKIADRRNICHIVNNFFFFDISASEHARIAERLNKCRQDY